MDERRIGGGARARDGSRINCGRFEYPSTPPLVRPSTSPTPPTMSYVLPAAGLFSPYVSPGPPFLTPHPFPRGRKSLWKAESFPAAVPGQYAANSRVAS
jgi:hypothetical protein